MFQYKTRSHRIMADATDSNTAVNSSSVDSNDSNIAVNSSSNDSNTVPQVETTTTTVTTTQTKTLNEYLLKKQVAPLIGIDPEGPWSVVSEMDGLVMLHADPEADINLYRHLRGVVVDLATGQILCTSYPTTPKIVSSVVPVDENGNIKFGQYLLDKDQFRFKIGFEGTMIHVFKAYGKVYRVTRKRMDPSRSRWGNSKTFGEMYWELSGPKDEELFDPEKDFSPYCHSFIMVHPDVLVASRDSVSTGYLVYLGPKQMYSFDTLLYPLEKVDEYLRVPAMSSRPPESTSTHRIYAPENITLEEANKQLLFGFYEPMNDYTNWDARLLPGEFVILEHIETGDTYRIESEAYAWRSAVRNNNPNLLHRFYELLDYAYLKNNVEDDRKYFAMFPLLTTYDQNMVASWLTTVPLVLWPQLIDKKYEVPRTRDTKLYNIWQVMFSVVPLHRQAEVLGFYDHLLRRRQELATWMVGLSSRFSSLDLTEYSKRAQDILVKTRQFAIDRVRRGENMDPRTREFKTVEQLTTDNIRNFLGKELGSSLYRLIREMDRLLAAPAVESH